MSRPLSPVATCYSLSEIKRISHSEAPGGLWKVRSQAGRVAAHHCAAERKCRGGLSGRCCRGGPLDRGGRKDDRPGLQRLGVGVGPRQWQQGCPVLPYLTVWCPDGFLLADGGRKTMHGRNFLRRSSGQGSWRGVTESRAPGCRARLFLARITKQCSIF